jgi:signal transduction histidine kinase
LLIGLALLVVIVTISSGSGLYGLYLYRSLVKSLSARAHELPKATALIDQASELRVMLCQLQFRKFADDAEDRQTFMTRVTTELNDRLVTIKRILDSYQWQLDYSQFEVEQLTAGQHERNTFDEVERTYDHMLAVAQQPDWAGDPVRVRDLQQKADRLQKLASELPAYLHDRMQRLGNDVRVQYRSLIWLSWVTSVSGATLLLLLVKLFYDWIFRPLRILIKGSRRVAGGNFGFRIELDSQDEMAELADAMNDMTDRFRSIRDDLDRQVRERTKQVIRNEQLASVGFLAAGVAHEINNPLASIAMGAESLESRIAALTGNDSDHAEHAVIRQYLHMIQTEAFRCKEITERLLDFSRMGDTQRQPVELRELVQSVIDMVRHLDKYKHKRLELLPGPEVVGRVNPQEIKQVMLNLLTNALDSIDTDGVVQVELGQRGRQIELIVSDNGCGMTPEVLEHLFEPFFTRKRGGQGTGLGLSISFRIIADHGGEIVAASPGPGQGSQFRVTLPSEPSAKETRHRYQAA